MIRQYSLIIACAVAICSGACLFAGNDIFAPILTNESLAVPINSEMILARVPNQPNEIVLVRDFKNRNLLASKNGWKAIERPDRNMLNMYRGVENSANWYEYCFIGGLLNYATLGKTDCEIDLAKLCFSTNSISTLWPTRQSRCDNLKNSDIWRGSHRLRLFSRNPNRDALIFVQMSLLLLGLIFYFHSRVVKAGLTLALVCCFVAVVLTQSRGGLLALVIGILPFLYFRLRVRFSWKAFGKFFIVLALTAVAAYYGGFSKRISEMARGRDVSSSNRVVMWKEVPRMIAAAPMGWGLWQSGAAYNAWFEPPTRMHMTGDLFNDHLSRLVEGGYIFGGLYIFAWVFLLMLGWRLASMGGLVTPLALLVSYWVAACFNPMMYWPPSFYLPLLTALFFFISRRPSLRCIYANVRKPFLISSFVSFALVGILILSTFMAGAQDVPIRVSTFGRRVVVGSGEPTVWVADDGFVLSGDYNGFPGRELRFFYQKHPSADAIGIVERLQDLPTDANKLVVTGKLCEEFIAHSEKMHAEQVVFYSPPFASTAIASSIREKFNIKLMTGQYAARLTGDDKVHRKWVRIVPGAELYVPNWLEMMFGADVK